MSKNSLLKAAKCPYVSVQRVWWIFLTSQASVAPSWRQFDTDSHFQCMILVPLRLWCLVPAQYTCTSLGMRLVIHIVVDAVIVILQPPREEIPFAHSLRTAYSQWERKKDRKNEADIFVIDFIYCSLYYSRTTYRLQVYQCGTTVIPNLEDSKLAMNLAGHLTVESLGYKCYSSCLHSIPSTAQSVGSCVWPALLCSDIMHSHVYCIQWRWKLHSYLLHCAKELWTLSVHTAFWLK